MEQSGVFEGGRERQRVLRSCRRCRSVAKVVTQPRFVPLGVHPGPFGLLRLVPTSSTTSTTMTGSVHSLDSFDSVDDHDVDAGYDSDEEYRLAQKEWEESLQQLQQLFSIVLLPFLGRWVGRKWSYWGESVP